jgi:hypothetical protein
LIQIPKSTLSRWKNRIDKIKRKGKYDDVLPKIITIITTLLEVKPFVNADEMIKHIFKTTKISCSKNLIYSVMKKIKYTCKNPKFVNYPNEERLKTQIQTFCSDFKSLNNKFNSHPIVSLDEVGFSSNIRPLKIWSKRGKTKYIKVKPNINTKNKSVCVCVTSDGNISNYKISDKPYTKIIFLEFLKSLSFPENTIILLDNVRFHHSKEVIKHALEQKWNLLYTPPYSPWFNPIENVFSVAL